jgi:hypothetical protein
VLLIWENVFYVVILYATGILENGSSWTGPRHPYFEDQSGLWATFIHRILWGLG